MNSKLGKVGAHEIEFISVPTLGRGEVSLRVSGKAMTVRFERKGSSLKLYFDDRVVEYSFIGRTDDEGKKSYSVRAMGDYRTYHGISWARESDQVALGGSGGAKHKGLKVKSQMPGKIVKVLVSSGQRVEPGTPLLVMEAMKMENEIRSTVSGLVKEIKVQAGQAVETGVLLISIEG